MKIAGAMCVLLFVPYRSSIQGKQAETSTNNGQHAAYESIPQQPDGTDRLYRIPTRMRTHMHIQTCCSTLMPPHSLQVTLHTTLSSTHIIVPL